MPRRDGVGARRVQPVGTSADTERRTRARRPAAGCASAVTGEVTDRIAGMEETRTARRIAAALAPRIAEAELAVHSRQREFLGKRIERRQTETLIEEAEALDKGRQGGVRSAISTTGSLAGGAPREKAGTRKHRKRSSVRRLRVAASERILRENVQHFRSAF